MSTRSITERKLVSSTRGLLKVVCLGLLSAALSGSAPQARAQTDLPALNPPASATAPNAAAPSGSQQSAGVHGRVYALDKSGKIIGNVSGAKIELKNQAGAVVATVTSGQNGYYKVDLPAGQYFYKVTAPGYKDEDKGRGFTLQRSDQGHIYDFWLIQGPNDPDKKPPEIPAVEIGKLKGHVWEKTEKGDLIGIPNAAIALRRNGSPQMTSVFTRGAGKQVGFYSVVLQTGSWRASVKAPGFEMLVDPKPIAIAEGKETTRDFVLRRRVEKPPTNQGIKGIVRVRSPRTEKLPADLKVEIHPVTSPMAGGEAVTVDSRGGFRRDLAPGSYRVQASAEGYRTADSGVKFVFPGKYTMVDLLLLAEHVPETTPETPPGQPEEPGGIERPTKIRLALKVVEESPQGQRPLPGAKLLVRRGNQRLRDAQRGSTNKSGMAEFVLPEAGPYVALAQAEGFEPSGIKFEVAPNAKLSRTIILSRRGGVPPIEPGPRPDDAHGDRTKPVRVSGYLIRKAPESPTGAYGVSGASLIWSPVGDRRSRPQNVSTGKTGNFDLVLPEGDYRVGFKLPGDYQPKRPELVKVRAGMGKQWFYALKAPPREPGTVEPEPGEPGRVNVDVQGAVVVRSPHARGGYAGVPGAVVQWHPRSATLAEPRAVRSDKGGAFSLQLGIGAYTAEVVPPRGYQHMTKIVRVHPGMPKTLLVLERTPQEGPHEPGTPPVEPGPGSETRPPEGPRRLNLVLQVFERAGRRTIPLGAAQIRISGQKQLFMTDRNGRLTVPLPPGKYDVVATKPGFNMERRQVVVSGRGAVAPPIYLQRQPIPGGSEITPPGEGQTPPPQHLVPLQLRVIVTSPRPAKHNQPGGWTTSPARGASVR
ncbi:MAG: carboxypeptidase regulatory-like domain-containing protein, partial [Pirellulales bacterium]|nr:carboxypeptidase regulatory-like domain-containing protein [Pirellulales bacterium]